MNYVKIYQQLIDRSKGRILTEYKEKHHIIPRCLGGSDHPSNLAVLTAEEHYLAHLLLIKIYPDVRGLIYAAKLMSGSKNNKTYGWLKKKISKTGFTQEHKNNIGKSQSGRKQTPEHIEKRRQALINRTDNRIYNNDLKRRLKKDNAIITAVIYAFSR